MYVVTFDVSYVAARLGVARVGGDVARKMYAYSWELLLADAMFRQSETYVRLNNCAAVCCNRDATSDIARAFQQGSNLGEQLCPLSQFPAGRARR